MTLLYKKHIIKESITEEILKQFSKVKTKSKEILFHQGLSEVLGIQTNFLIVSTPKEKLKKLTFIEELKNPKNFKMENYFIEHFNQYLKVRY